METKVRFVPLIYLCKVQCIFTLTDFEFLVNLNSIIFYEFPLIMNSWRCVTVVLYCSVQAEEDEGLTAVADYIQQNNVPIPFLMMLFAHFMSMVVDRLLQHIVCICIYCGFCFLLTGRYT